MDKVNRKQETTVTRKLKESVITTEVHQAYIKFYMFLYSTCKEFQRVLNLRFSQQQQDVTLCAMAEIHHFRETYCLHLMVNE
jgi:hypothetical protein